MADITIARMLTDLGFTHPDAQQSAIEALIKAGVISSKPNRTRIASDKRGRVASALAEAFVRHCNNGDCRQAAAQPGPRRPLLADRQHCEVCGGSANRSALERLARALQERGLRRVLVVGGTEASERDIRQSSPASVEWRFVNTQVARDDRYHRSNREWAEVMAIWSSTPLPHKVSRHYEYGGDLIRVTVTRRGVAALADGVRERLERQPAPRGSAAGR